MDVIEDELGAARATAEAAEAVPPDTHWQRTLVGLWFALFAYTLGIGFALPFLPLFMARELHVNDPHQLAFWVGLAPASLGICLAVASPIWGAAADRFGRKAMLVRALFGAALVISLISVARAPIQVVAAEAGFGLLAGAGQLSMALAAKEMARQRVGFGIGVVQSASAVGQSIGPVLGSVASLVLGLRTAFVFGGAVVVAGVVPVLTLVQERRLSRSDRARRPGLATAARKASPGTFRAIVLLMVAQAISWSSFTAAGPMVSLRILHMAPGGTAATATGATFAIASVATAITALSYSRVAARIGFRRIAMLAALTNAVALAGLALAPSIPITAAAYAVVGIGRGVLAPAIPSMVGLESPPEVISTALGFNSSAQSVGIAVGPLLAGLVAAVASVPVALGVAAALAAVLGSILYLGVREPAP